MFITTASRLALTAAALCAAASTADARPRRLVVLDFDGPRQLADNGRSSVLTALGDQYDVIATKRWEQARAAAAQQTHGPAQWSRAAKQAGVDAVIEGWVQDEGRRKILNVVVREAGSGKEFDTISVRIDGKAAMSTETTRRLADNLNELLDWIDAGHDEPTSTLPVIDPRKVGRTASELDAPRPRVRNARIEDDGDEPSPRGRRSADEETVTRSRRRVADDEPRAAAPAPVDEPGTGDTEAADEPTRPAARPAKSIEVSIAARDASAMETMFPQNTVEHTEIFGENATRPPVPTPRFLIDAGPYYDSRSLGWDAEGDGVPQFAGVASQGVSLSAAVYPFPSKAKDGVLSGFGATGEIHHSLGASVISEEGDTINEYVINQNGFELGAHYRGQVSSLVAIDGGAFYGNQTYEIVDASPEFETPDTKYSYVGIGAHLDLAITDRALVGFGARYFTVLDSGDLASTEFFGPAQASGLGLEASFVIPLPSNLYVRGQLAYQRIGLELSGGGKITDEEGVTGGKDARVRGNVNIGIAF